MSPWATKTSAEPRIFLMRSTMAVATEYTFFDDLNRAALPFWAPSGSLSNVLPLLPSEGNQVQHQIAPNRDTESGSRKKHQRCLICVVFHGLPYSILWSLRWPKLPNFHVFLRSWREISCDGQPAQPLRGLSRWYPVSQRLLPTLPSASQDQIGILDVGICWAVESSSWIIE